jgi:hypothetical protein
LAAQYPQATTLSLNTTLAPHGSESAQRVGHSAVGDAVGLALGATVGDAVGVTLGDGVSPGCVGDAVGDAVGDLLGAAVGQAAALQQPLAVAKPVRPWHVAHIVSTGSDTSQSLMKRHEYAIHACPALAQSASEL